MKKLVIVLVVLVYIAITEIEIILGVDLELIKAICTSLIIDLIKERMNSFIKEDTTSEEKQYVSAEIQCSLTIVQ